MSSNISEGNYMSSFKDTFDMIVGTSTGALIAFALVGGRCDENGERAPMTLQEIIGMYKDLAPQIFPKPHMIKQVGFITRPFMHLRKSCIPAPLVPFKTKKVREELEKFYGQTTLSDFSKEGCVAGKIIITLDNLKMFRNNSFQGLLQEIWIMETQKALRSWNCSTQELTSMSK